MNKFKVSVEKKEPIFTLPYTIFFGNTSVAFCDNEVRVDMITRALEAWQDSDDYKKWFREHIEPNTGMA